MIIHERTSFSWFCCGEQIVPENSPFLYISNEINI